MVVATSTTLGTRVSSLIPFTRVQLEEVNEVPQCLKLCRKENLKLKHLTTEYERRTHLQRCKGVVGLITVNV